MLPTRNQCCYVRRTIVVSEGGIRTAWETLTNLSRRLPSRKSRWQIYNVGLCGPSVQDLTPAWLISVWKETRTLVCVSSYPLLWTWANRGVEKVTPWGWDLGTGPSSTPIIHTVTGDLLICLQRLCRFEMQNEMELDDWWERERLIIFILCYYSCRWIETVYSYGQLSWFIGFDETEIVMVSNCTEVTLRNITIRNIRLKDALQM